MTCPQCGINPTHPHDIYGAVPCTQCLEDNTARKNLQPVEFTSDEVKHQRKEFYNSTLQPYRQGVPSKEFVEAYPEKAKAQFGDEMGNAQYVWQGEPGWEDRGESR